MKSSPVVTIVLLVLYGSALAFIGYGQSAFWVTPVFAAGIPTATSTTVPTKTPLPSRTPTATLVPTRVFTATPTQESTSTATLTPSPTKEETLSEKLRTHIVFYLIAPEKGRLDACGSAKAEPIISKRYRTGNKLQDVQIALNMLFSIGVKHYGTYYNALWDTHFTIEAVDYNIKKDYMTITFGGYFPFTQLSDCDKQGIREQIWSTFFHYGFREKTFKYYDKFLIDRLGGD